MDDLKPAAPPAKPVISPRVACLQEAAEITAGDRAKAYGDPVPKHQKIADLFNAATGHKVTAREAAIFHMCTKLARLSRNPLHRDSHVDLMAYSGIAYECALAEAKAKADAV